jgi:hypothetical protein
MSGTGSDAQSHSASSSSSAFARLRTFFTRGREAPLTTTREVIGWWEARRVPFNLIVGIAGLISCIVVAIVGLGSEILFGGELGLPDPPIFALVGVLAYAVLANICFTGGWIVEIIVRKLWPGECDNFGTTSFALGVIFSLLLTLAPGIIIGSAGIFGLLRKLLGIAHA